MTAPRPRLLFVCVENSNRSQMAEAFARMLGADRVDAWSAGSRPSGHINPRAIASMKELGFMLDGQRSKSLDEVPPGPYDVIVTMGCGDACPHLAAKRREDWQIPDPRDLDALAFAGLRDAIRAKVEALLASLRVAHR